MLKLEETTVGDIREALKFRLQNLYLMDYNLNDELTLNTLSNYIMDLMTAVTEGRITPQGVHK